MLGSFYKTFKASPEEKEEELEKTIEKIKRNQCITVEPPIWENGVTPLNAENLNKLSEVITSNLKVTNTGIDISTEHSSLNYDNIFEEMMKRLSVKPVLKHQCTNCLAVLELDINKRIFHCPYCNAVYAISEG